MAITVKHNKVSTVPDTADTSLVRPSDWNADHTVVGLGTAAELNAGVPNGVATLDGSGKVPTSQIPLQGDLNYQGAWNASTNTPTLASGTGTKGYYYVVSVAGTTNLDGITDWQVGDWAIFNGTIWQKVDNTDTVTSVNGQVGAVVLTTTNIAEGTNEYFTQSRARQSISAGTGISYDNSTGVVTNSAPDQTVVLNAGTGISTSGTYPNFTITNTSPSLGGDVVGPASATDNAIARFDSTTGKLIQNSVVTVGDTGAATGFTTLSASTSVSTPIVKATSSAGGALQNASGTNQIQWGSGGGDNISLDVSTNMNGANAQIDISPTGTGHVHIKPTGTGSLEIAPTNVGTIDNMNIGGTTPKNGSFVDLSVSGTTSFDGQQGTAGQVLTSQGSGNTPTWTTPTTGTVTSVNLSAGTGISVSGGPITSSGSMTVTNTAPDQVVSISAGTGISVSGTYPNFTVTNTSPSSGGTVTSVNVSGGTTGLTTSGGPVTGSGTITLAGTLGVANGGTGLTSLSANRVPYGNGTSALGNEADFTYDPSLNTVTAPQVSASNGIFVNSATVAADYSIPSGSNGMSAGPVTINSGITVTVPSGSNWVVI